MAEGHTIHRLARDLRELIGVPLSISSPQGRFAEAKLLDGLSMLDTDARGKHLLARFDIASLHVHLGLAGIFVRMEPAGPPRPQVRLRLAGGSLAWDLTAPTRCELLDEVAVKALISRLGPDPLRSDADPEKVWNRLQRYSGSVGAALLDQSIIAGVGNVYRAEALWAIGIHPARPAGVLTRTEFDQLWQTLVSMMQQGVEEGRIITVDTPPHVDRASLPQERARNVYRQSECRQCGTPVEVATIGGRRAYACPSCQT